MLIGITIKPVPIRNQPTQGLRMDEMKCLLGRERPIAFKVMVHELPALEMHVSGIHGRDAGLGMLLAFEEVQHPGAAPRSEVEHFVIFL